MDTGGDVSAALLPIPTYDGNPPPSTNSSVPPAARYVALRPTVTGSIPVGAGRSPLRDFADQFLHKKKRPRFTEPFQTD